MGYFLSPRATCKKLKCASFVTCFGETHGTVLLVICTLHFSVSWWLAGRAESRVRVRQSRTSRLVEMPVWSDRANVGHQTVCQALLHCRDLAARIYPWLPFLVPWAPLAVLLSFVSHEPKLNLLALLPRTNAVTEQLGNSNTRLIHGSFPLQ